MSAGLPVRLLEGDMHQVRTRDALKRVIISVLREVGLLPVPPPTDRPRPGLRLVKGEADKSGRELE